MLTKILIRPDNFHLRYQHWQEKYKVMHIEMLRGSYANEVFGQGAENLKYESSNQYSRITWQTEDVSIDALCFLNDYFRNMLLKNNYSVQLSDERIEVFDNGLKLTIQRHYLKPKANTRKNESLKTNGLFGNIFLEHRFNKQHNTLCITCNYFNNKQYLSFEKLMELLLTE